MAKTHSEFIYRIDIDNIETLLLFIKVIENALNSSCVEWPEIGDDGVACLSILLQDLREEYIKQKNRTDKE